MEIAINAAHWVLGRALGPVSDGLLESWAASSELGPNVRALKLELLYAQGMLGNAHGRDVRNAALVQLLLELRNHAYNADDVLDELEYFRIQDELEGSYEATDADERGLIGGLLLNARHTARNFAGKLRFSSCSSASASSAGPDGDGEDAKQGCLPGGCNCSGGGQNPPRTRSSPATSPTNQVAHEGGCMPMVISSACNTVRAIGKRLPCSSLPSAGDNAHTRPCVCGGAWSSKAQAMKHMHAPKPKFDRVEMSKKMKDIVEQLKPICAKVATILELELLGPNSTPKQGTSLDRPKTTPEILEPKLYGRDHQKKSVVDDITHGKYSANNLTVLSIVGPGGIGKTTFTQHIYEEVKKKSHFHVPIWICVSLDYSADRLARDIVKQIPEVTGESKNSSDTKLIEERLQSKQFLLVLDDMWTYHEDEWKKLLAPFRKGGTKGNMVIVTTRIPKVANMVAAEDCVISLGRLEHKDCMQFFQACVFVGKQSWEGHKDLHEVAENIVTRLKGYPLAVKTVGRLLRNQLTRDYWKRVLDSKEWELQTNDDDIMPALKLSYNYLSFDLQQCFSHCALFPEDYEFDKDELIHLWIGLGLLCSSGGNRKIEDIGLGNLNDLVNYGFFQKNKKKDGGPCFVIHDLLHELAVNVSSHECLSLHASKVRSIHIPASVRHMSIIIDNTVVKDRRTFDDCKEELSILGGRLRSENLRTLMLFGEHHGAFLKTFGDLFRKAKALRVIFLSGASYNLEALLHNLSNLVHLRYIRIKDDGFTEIGLPINVSRFYHLMVLDLKQCKSLNACVRDMHNLVKICHFLVRDDTLYSEIFEVGKLKCLHELRRFEMKKETCGFELNQLGQLQELGSLGIYNLERVEEIKEADEAKLVHMSHLDQLTLDWDINRSNKDPKKEDDVLESLKPHSELRKIRIRGHGGSTCPTWLGADLSIKNLEHLRLDGVSWKNLPPLGELWMVNEHGEEYLSCVTVQSFQNLKRIELVNIPRLKRWCGSGTCQTFSHLEELSVESCSELTELPFSHYASCQGEQGEIMTWFPKLRKVCISNCPKLSSLPPIPWTRALCNVNISRVGTGIERLYYMKSEQSKYIQLDIRKDAPNSALPNMLAFDNMSEVEEFRIIQCPPLPLDGMQMLASLKALTILDYSNVLWPIECENNARYKFPVQTLRIQRCGANGKELTQFVSYFPGLSELTLDECEAVTRLGVAEKESTAPSPSASDGKTEGAQIGQQEKQQAGGEDEIEAATEGLLLLPPQIQVVRIYNCPDLMLCSSSLDDNAAARLGLQGLCSLQSLSIIRCSKFLSSSSSSSSYCPFPTSLQTLYLAGVEGMFTLAPLSNLTTLLIRDCEELRWEGLWHLLAQGHLTELTINGSPNLFLGLEPSRMCNEDPPLRSRQQLLRTDDKAGILAVPICAHLFSSITKLIFCSNNDMERFSKEQEEAIRTLTFLQELSIQFCDKLQSLPAGLRALPDLNKLEISFCSAIRSFPNDRLPDSLTELNISCCPSIRSLPKGCLPSSLQTLNVRYSDNEELKRQCRKLKGTIPIVRV